MKEKETKTNCKKMQFNLMSNESDYITPDYICYRLSSLAQEIKSKYLRINNKQHGFSNL